MRDLLVLIPARASSKGLPGKNLTTVAGISLVGRAVLSARAFLRQLGLESRARILVDTDGEAIAVEGRRWGAEVPFLRPANLATDTTQTVDNVLHAWNRLDREARWLVLLQPTSPLRRAEDIIACWTAVQRSGAQSAVSVSEASHPVQLAMLGGANQPLDWALGEAPISTRRQDHPAAVWPNGAVYVTTFADLERLRLFLVAGRTLGVPMSLEASVDVDSANDLTQARLGAWSAPPTAYADTPLLDLRGLSLEAAVESYLAALLQAKAPALLFGGPTAQTPEDANAAFSLRSTFGAPVCWDVSGASPNATRRALLLGVSTVRGTVPAEWQSEAEGIRRIGA